MEDDIKNDALHFRSLQKPLIVREYLYSHIVGSPEDEFIVAPTLLVVFNPSDCWLGLSDTTLMRLINSSARPFSAGLRYPLASRRPSAPLNSLSAVSVIYIVRPPICDIRPALPAASAYPTAR